VEHNTYCVSAHFRNCAAESWQDVVKAVEAAAEACGDVVITRGRKVLEVRPQVGALLYVL
jgi:trehalose 6-phosphate phosphatase